MECHRGHSTFFGTAVLEVTDIKEKADGTIILTVDAVCEMLLCDDAVMTHELTAQFAEGGSFQYPGNKIRNTEMGEKPPCQYRIGKEKAE